MRIVIDGYNTIAAMAGLRPNFPRDLENARKNLRGMLVRYKKVRGHRITVVYDAQGGQWGGAHSETVAGIKEVFTAEGENADKVIVRMARHKPDGLIVVTGDRDVEYKCTKAGASVITPAELEEKIMEAVLLGDKGATIKDEDYTPSHSTKKKGPSRRMKKSSRLKSRRKSKL